jgi:hypothetical protein
MSEVVQNPAVIEADPFTHGEKVWELVNWRENGGGYWDKCTDKLTELAGYPLGMNESEPKTATHKNGVQWYRYPTGHVLSYRVNRIQIFAPAAELPKPVIAEPAEVKEIPFPCGELVFDVPVDNLTYWNICTSQLQQLTGKPITMADYANLGRGYPNIDSWYRYADGFVVQLVNAPGMFGNTIRLKIYKSPETTIPADAPYPCEKVLWCGNRSEWTEKLEQFLGYRTAASSYIEVKTNKDRYWYRYPNKVIVLLENTQLTMFKEKEKPMEQQPAVKELTPIPEKIEPAKSEPYKILCAKYPALRKLTQVLYPGFLFNEDMLDLLDSFLAAALQKIESVTAKLDKAEKEGPATRELYKTLCAKYPSLSKLTQALNPGFLFNKDSLDSLDGYLSMALRKIESITAKLDEAEKENAELKAKLAAPAPAVSSDPLERFGDLCARYPALEAVSNSCYGWSHDIDFNYSLDALLITVQDRLSPKAENGFQWPTTGHPKYSELSKVFPHLAQFWKIVFNSAPVETYETCLDSAFLTASCMIEKLKADEKAAVARLANKISEFNTDRKYALKLGEDFRRLKEEAGREKPITTKQLESMFEQVIPLLAAVNLDKTSTVKEFFDRLENVVCKSKASCERFVGYLARNYDVIVSSTDVQGIFAITTYILEKALPVKDLLNLSNPCKP